MQISDKTILCGDSFDILPNLSIGKYAQVHMITDPPYSEEAHGTNRRLGSGTKREIKSEALDFSPIDHISMVKTANAAAKMCNGWFLAFCQAEDVARWKTVIEDCDLKYRRAMVWIKPDSSPQLSGDRPAQGYESIVAAWCGDERSSWNGGGKRGVFTFGKHASGHGHGGRSNEHPTQKPIKLIQELIYLFTNPGDLIIDPFMGSGTTCIAAGIMGRHFIGIEEKQHYFEIAERRIQQHLSQQELFSYAD